MVKIKKKHMMTEEKKQSNRKWRDKNNEFNDDRNDVQSSSEFMRNLME